MPVSKTFFQIGNDNSLKSLKYFKLYLYRIMSVDPGTVACCAEDDPPAFFICDDSIFTPMSIKCEDAMKQYCDGQKFFDIQNYMKCNDFCDSPIGDNFCKNTKANYCAEQAKNNKFDTDEKCMNFCASNNCQEAIDVYCKGTNLETDYCKKRCSSSAYDCDTNLQEYCSSVPKSNLCPCFQDSSVYKKYYDDFMEKAEKNNIVISEINKLPYCSYPACSSSLFIPKDRQSCPSQCFQNVFIDSENNIVTDKINISQNCSLSPTVNCSQSLPCPSGYSCNTAGRCDKICSNDSDCSNNTICQKGICLISPTQCSDTSPCATGQVCQSGKCIVPTQCSDTSPCATGQVCQSGKCIPSVAGCTDSSQCASSETCLLSKCRSTWVVYGSIIGGGIVFLILFIAILWIILGKN